MQRRAPFCRQSAARGSAAPGTEKGAHHAPTTCHRHHLAVAAAARPPRRPPSPARRASQPARAPQPVRRRPCRNPATPPRLSSRAGEVTPLMAGKGLGVHRARGTRGGHVLKERRRMRRRRRPSRRPTRWRSMSRRQPSRRPMAIDEPAEPPADEVAPDEVATERLMSRRPPRRLSMTVRSLVPSSRLRTRCSPPARLTPLNTSPLQLPQWQLRPVRHGCRRDRRVPGDIRPAR